MPKNKYFYYSEEECRFVEVKRSYAALLGQALVVLSLAVLLTVGFMHFYGHQIVRDTQYRQLEAEVVQLTAKLNRAMATLEKLAESDNSLRRVVNLPLISVEEKALGVGGTRAKIDENNTAATLIAVSSQMIDRLARQVELQSESYAEILQKYEENKRFFACLPAIKPIDGTRTSPFGMRFHPIYRIMKFHSGQDFHAPIGTPVYATGDGVVESAQYNDGYGNCIIIDHGFGLKTLYAHLSKCLVKPGQAVRRGENIGLSGNTGVSDSPHLHYEVIKDGVKVNPLAYMLDEISPSEFLAAADSSAAANH
ncbi:MAG: M23 family metallopeptidase [Chloroherpetonaceae bacterium]|nr:M23 family metallopeptidase [Chloroherpetonaceae bacterium]MCS7212121.1 M23 family metallopeptidase [Chloroherpetonaceae bacterium]MDW8018742.1 M23 family metallopeptidase [Chloroherpetonaceae bacterium]